MKKSILNIGKSLNKMEQKAISGGTFSNVPQISIPGHDPDCPNPWVPCDGDGRDCRAPFHVNSFGRCTL